MIALSFSQIKKAYYEQTVLDSISFSINAQDKLGLIGRNGTGKTTILRLIAGVEEPDSGMIYMDSKLKVGYMKQTDELDEDYTLLSYCMSAFEDLLSLEENLTAMEHEMASFKTDNEDFKIFMSKYEALSHSFEQQGGYIFRSKVRGILNGLGFGDESHDRAVKSLSGGQFARLKLARLLIDEPDILILDEPTNHLDIATTSWLENYLKQYPKTLLLVSHDRYFLDSVCTKIMEIENSNTMIYDGNYTVFKKKKEAHLEQLKRQYEKAQSERAKQEELIRKFKQRGTEKLAKRAKSREKRLERLETPEYVASRDNKMKLNLKAGLSSGTEVLHVENLCKSYGEQEVIRDVSFNVFRGERIGLIGHNGTGKSTILKILEGSLDFDEGQIKFGHQVLCAYYDQSMEDLDPECTIIEEIHNFVPLMDEVDIRTLLGRFLFTSDDVFKPIKVLSGGEKARVMLTKLFLTDSNFLMMDEPTNHLDIYSKEVLEDALGSYDGTMIVISHDRYFLDKICDQILEIDNHELTLYHGGYSYYTEKKAALAAKDEPDKPLVTKTEKRQDKKKERQMINQKKSLQSQVSEIEAIIHSTETRLEEIAHELCDEAVYSDPEKTKAILSEEKQLKTTQEELYEKWEEINEQLSDM
ncbi:MULTISPECIES: ATP-binding cassette domain-containing protein [unclassified Fusibacter]|uniref:ABC transporter ATP-binding protein n=1 Tax=unclassified Fusibacter TaxID=2624464 RepID=UPI0013E9541E|nr:ATP-binding cassette domain-containing protein [Fusibacter sp. A1]MCK8059442.1 ATP-binding cassette domain-containing protein [Fusibacter sp. A2]NPE21094.1 ATP-binding cassette domain-containing protein [Fusibacter sp. A1]